MRIDVHTTVSLNSLRYFEYMRANYAALARAPGRLRFHAYCLDRPSALWLARDRALAAAVGLPYARGSTGHALGIEAALARCEPGAIHVVADSDTALFAEGWDDMLEQALAPGGYGILGVPYEDIGGFSSGADRHQTYKRIATTTWMALSPHHDFRALRALPDKDATIEIDGPERAAIYNLPVGSSVLKDVGWQIPGFIHERGMRHLALEMVKPDSGRAGPLAGTSPYHDEFHWDGRPFVAHQRGSMKHRFRIDPLSRDFYDACDAFLGSPAWSVRPGALDRAVAAAQDVLRACRRVLAGARRA